MMLAFGDVANANANAVKSSKLDPFEIKLNCESKQFDVCVVYCVVRSFFSGQAGRNIFNN